MRERNWTINLTLLSFILLALILSVILVGCVRRLREPRIIDQHAPAIVITTTPGALFVTPTHTPTPKPWFWYRNRKYIPVEPAESPLVQPERQTSYFDPGIDCVQAYAILDD